MCVFSLEKIGRKYLFNQYFWNAYYAPGIVPVNSPWGEMMYWFYFFFLFVCISTLAIY